MSDLDAETVAEFMDYVKTLPEAVESGEWTLEFFTASTRQPPVLVDDTPQIGDTRVYCITAIVKRAKAES